MATINLNETSIIILGSWNQAILNVNWIRENIDSLKNESPIVQAQYPTFPIPIRLEYENLYIMPEQASLVLRPKNETSEAMKSIKIVSQEILKLLPHTPISAIGHNFSYTLESNELFKQVELELDKNLKESITSHGDLVFEQIDYTKKSFGLKFADKSYDLNLSFINNIISKTLQINFNYHYNMAGKPPENLLETLSKFVENFECSGNIVSNSVGNN